MENIFKGNYKGRRVLVTGHTGFKGSWLTQWLISLGAEVTGYSLEPPTDPSLFDSLNMTGDMKHLVGDVRDLNKLKLTFDEARPEMVFHLAAQPIVRLSYSEPVSTYDTNIMGTVHILEAVRTSPSVRAVVVITSDKCYDNKEWVFGYRENDPMGGYDPYSSSKGCAELVTSAYKNSFFNSRDHGTKHNVAVASARAGNVIGGGDWAADRLVPDCARFITRGEPIIIRRPDATRPWQHVLEPLSGYLLLGARLWEEPVKYSEGWNFGPSDDDVLTVDAVVRKVLDVWKRGEYRVESDNVLHEATLLKLDISKAHFRLGWKPVYRAEEAIEKTVRWYDEYYYGKGKSSMKDYTMGQIEEYIQSARQAGLPWA